MHSTLNRSVRSTPPSPWKRLSWVTAGVLLAHWGGLYALPPASVALRAQDNQPSPLHFTIRTLTETQPAVAPPETPTITTEQEQYRGSGQKERPVAPAPVDTTPIKPKFIPFPEPDANAPAMQEDQLAAVTTTETDAVAPAKPSDALPPQNYAVPGSVRLKYEVRGEKGGIPVFANGELLWVQDGKTYEARMEISILMFGRVQTSKGQLGAHGLEPVRFGDKVRSEVAAHFDRARGKVTFSANTPDVAMLPGAQDQLSIFMHVASMIGGDPRRFPPGTELSFQAIGPRSAETWAFTVGNLETLTLPGGTVKALKLSRPPANEYSPRADVWLAPEMAYMPVRIRLKEANGDVADQQWSATQKP